MQNISILDCTLRDGGYINAWKFGHKNISRIIQSLVDANIDYIECGFLADNALDPEKSIFASPSNLANLVPVDRAGSKLALMVNPGECDPKTLEKNSGIIDIIRIAFKKEQIQNTFTLAEAYRDKGYAVCLNPMHTSIYSEEELVRLLELVNKFSPYALSIVDTTGTMRKKSVLQLYHLINNNLNPEITIGFHSHNNLQLSFSNAQELMSLSDQRRKLIIDSSVFGMGRGAGNLPTELLAQSINDEKDVRYNLVPILKIIDEQLGCIFAQTPWGYSVPYYLAAVNNCHPNYASYLTEKQTVPVGVVNNLLANVPDAKKSGYDEKLIEGMYLAYQANQIDDSTACATIKQLIGSKPVLVLAPGSSLVKERSKIDSFINEFKPFVISLNAILDFAQNVDLAFISNAKRLDNIEDTETLIVVTSNIKNIPKKTLIVNYSSYINSSFAQDNVALMLVKLLIKIGVREVSFAGLDGFTRELEDYYDRSFVRSTVPSEIDRLNNAIITELQKFERTIKLNFVTTSLYNKML